MSGGAPGPWYSMNYQLRTVLTEIPSQFLKTLPEEAPNLKKPIVKADN